MEIVTWVLSGSLMHHDSEGHADLVYPNLAQRMTAGALRGTDLGDARHHRMKLQVIALLL
jgi:Pirin